MDAILEVLQARFREPEGMYFTSDDIATWTGESGETISALLDRLSDEIAKGYHAKTLSYEFCDEVVNHLFGELMAALLENPALPDPTLFYQVYDAFDAGEYHHKEDRSDDPVAEFTDPAIADIVARY